MSKPTLTPELLAELLQRYPTENNRTLAAEFGLSVHKVANIAFNNGVKKATSTRWQRHEPDGILGAVHRAADAKGPSGIDRQAAIAAMPQYQPGSVCAALRLATERGLLHRAGRPRFYRWFAAPAHALAYNAAAFGSALANKAPPAQRGPAHNRAAPVVTSATRHTVCPPTGWRQPAAAPECGLFSNLQPGRYLDDEAKPWIIAATSKGQRP